MDARKLLKKMDYLPRWIWYLLSLSVGGPFGAIGVYAAFHVLEKMAAEQDDAKAKQAHWDGADRIYADDDCVVSSDEDVSRQWESVQQSAARAKAQPKKSAPDAGQPIGENADVKEVIQSGYDAMRRIRQANDVIADEALSAQIDSIENSCGQILSLLEERENLLPQLRTFLRYYLPTTLRLLDARAKLENTASTPKAREVRARISEAVGVIDKAFVKQLEALDAYRFIDLESEMDVLRDMLKSDGLLEEREDDDPFAAVLGGK